MKLPKFLMFAFVLLAAIHQSPATDFAPNVRADDGFPSYDHVLNEMTADPQGNIYVIFADTRSGNPWSRVYAAKSTDQGATWSSPNTLVSDTTGWEYDYPQIAAGPNGVVYATFYHRPFASGGVYFTRSTDAGATWEHPSRRLDEGLGIALGQHVIQPLGGDSVMVLWADDDMQLLTTRSFDAGVNWTNPHEVDTSLTAELWLPSICRSDGGDMYIAAQGNDGASAGILVMRSTDSGTTWSEPVQAANPPGGTSQWASVASRGDGVFVAYVFAHGFGMLDIYFAGSTDFGQTWNAVPIQINDVPGYAVRPRIAISEDGVCEVVYQDYRTGDSDIYYSHSEDVGYTWSPGEVVNDDSSARPQMDPVIWTGSGYRTYISWGDERAGYDSCGVYFSRVIPPPASARRPASYVPVCMSLSAFPNPFNAATALTYTLAHPGHTTLRLYDVLGRQAAVLLDGFLTAGSHRFLLNAGAFPSGTYIVRLSGGSFSEYRKIELVR